MARSTDLLTETETAERLRRSPETLRYWRWRSEGPPSFKIGRRVMYDAADLNAWIEAQKTNGAA
ncbi:MAG: helix-turn-helix transcriptional regulator [Pseudonocardiaceae bacterium]